MTKRKLASIQKISDLKPIENADLILQATVLGWGIVVKKNEFKIGDRCVFFEIDSILPDGPKWSEFMRPRKFRVKTCKLRGVLSQGLAMSLSILGGPSPNRGFLDKILFRDGWHVGDDVTSYLGIKKYDPYVKTFGFSSGKRLRDFPLFIPKTDEIRIQSSMKKLSKIKGEPIYVTIKYDGTSATFYKLDDGTFGVCSRNREVKDSDNVYWDMARKYCLEDRIPCGFAVQGEICGPKICGNKLRLIEPQLYVFDVFDIKLGRYLGYDSLINFCSLKHLDMVECEFNLDDWEDFDNSLDSWLHRAVGKYYATEVDREGLVVRTKDRRISFKVINNDYLLKEK